MLSADFQQLCCLVVVIDVALSHYSDIVLLNYWVGVLSLLRCYNDIMFLYHCDAVFLRYGNVMLWRYVFTMTLRFYIVLLWYGDVVLWRYSDELSDRGFVDGSIGSELKLMVPSDQNLDAYSDLSIGSDESSLYISTTIIPSEPVTTSSDSLWPSVQKLGYRHESYVNAVQRLRNTNRTLDLNTLLEYLVTESTLPSAPITSTNPVQSNKSQLQRQSAPPSSSSVSTSKVDSSQLRLIVIDGSNVAME